MEVILTETDDAVRVITLHRPEARNALNVALLEALTEALHQAEEDDAVDVLVLTGADPAFCAGLDLYELAAGGTNLRGTGDRPLASPFAAVRHLTKPLLGAINGPAVTGGLELALGCDFLVASERAVFGDTHARVGAMPGGGMTGLLPRAVGLAMAKEMSFTGNFIDATEALRLGLVNRVVAHDELLPTTLRLAHDVAANDRHVVRRLKRNYDLGAAGTLAEALRIELDDFRSWTLSPEEVARRREGILERGRSQTTPRGPASPPAVAGGRAERRR